MPITRFEENPLIKPADIKPYIDGFEVVCTFNAGCTVYQDEILLLLRVAERPIVGPNEIAAPVFQADAPSPGIHLIRVTPNDPEFEEIRNQAMAFEKFYGMASEFESYADHIQNFPDRVG